MRPSANSCESLGKNDGMSLHDKDLKLGTMKKPGFLAAGRNLGAQKPIPRSIGSFEQSSLLHHVYRENRTTILSRI